MLSCSKLFIVLSFFGLACANVLVKPSAPQVFSRATSGCPAGGQVSCHNTTVQSNLCCFESPGGLLLQTQFWDLSGPGASLHQNWTIHGLWPDFCDGSFTTNCDLSRSYSDITSIIQTVGPPELLPFMNTYWLDINGNNAGFWEHEWEAHGTCYSTLQTQCLPPSSPTGTDAVDFFLTVQRVFQSRPTYNFLANGGVTPSSTKTYTATQLGSILKTQAGVKPALNCNGNALNQVYWYFNLQGSVIDGTFIPIDAPTPGNCPSSGIKYPPKP